MILPSTAPSGLPGGLSIVSAFESKGVLYAAVNGGGQSGLLRRTAAGAWEAAAPPPAGATTMGRAGATADGRIFALGTNGHLYRLTSTGWARAIRHEAGRPIRDFDIDGNRLALRIEGRDRRSTIEIRDLVANTRTVLPALPATAGLAAAEGLRFDAQGVLWYLDRGRKALVAGDQGWAAARPAAALPDAFAQFGASLAAVPPGPALSIGYDAWTEVTQGLPANARIGGLAALGGKLFATAGLDGARYGLWRLDTGGWMQVAAAPAAADLRDLAAAGGRLYAQARGALWEFDPGRGTWLDVGLTAGIPIGDAPAVASDGQGRVYVFGGVQASPSVQVFDTATRRWTDLGPVDARSFRRGDVQLLADGAGGVWFATARDGIWRYGPRTDGSLGWTQASTLAGRLSLDARGGVLLSHAGAAGSGEMLVSAYAGSGAGDAAWSVVQRLRGDAAPGVTIGSGVTVLGGGRFDEVAFRGTIAWTLPSMEAASDDGAGNLDARVRDIVAIGNTVFAVGVREATQATTVQALTVRIPPDLTNEVWQNVSPVLPSGARVSNLAALGRTVYAAVDGAGTQTGLWAVEGDAWRFVAASPRNATIADLAAGADGRLYALIGGRVQAFDPRGGAWSDAQPRDAADPSRPFAGSFTLLAAQGGKVAALLNNNTAPTVQVLDTATGRWTDLGRVSADVLDGGGGSELRVDAKGGIWLRFGRSGLWRNDGTAWQQVSTRSGSLSIANDGAVFYAWDSGPGTQTALINRFVGGTGDGAFRLVQTLQGYGSGLSGVPFGASGVFIGGGRFDEVIFAGTRLARLPSMEAGQPDPNTIDARVRDVVTVDGAIYAIQDRDNTRVRSILRLDADAADAALFDSNLDVEVAGYLSDGTRPAAAAAVEILADGRIAALYNAGTGTDTSTYAEGRLDLLSRDGRSRLASVALGARVLDADLVQGPQGERLAVALRTGVVVVDPATGGIVARADGAVQRVAGLQDGGFVGLFEYQVPVPGVTRTQLERRIQVHGADGGLLRSYVLSTRSYVTDIEVNPAAGLIYVVGYDNKRLPSGLPVQVAFLSALDLATGTPRWQSYGFNGADLAKNVADTRLYRVETGPDGALYLGGESAGTESIFRFDGKRFDGAQTISSFDAYSSLSNTASPHLTFLARLDPLTGIVQDGVYSEARLGADSNTYRIKDGDFAVDAQGVIYQVGVSASQIANRGAQFVEGVQTGAYAGGDPVFQVLAPDFDSRYAWNALLGPDSGSGVANAVATRGGTTVVLSTITRGEGAVTEGALYGSRTASANVHLTVVDSHSLYAEPPGVDALREVDSLAPPLGTAIASPTALATTARTALASGLLAG